MKHYTEEDLVLHFYGESDDPQLAAHLAGCERCRADYDGLRRVFAAVDQARVPERPESYAADVWRRVEPRLGRRRPFGFLAGAWSRRGWFAPPRLAFAASMALLLLVAFVAGRQTAPAGEPLAADVRERVLLVAVGQHLERSQRLLLELLNTPAAPGIDLAEQRVTAGELVRDNRLYRQTAAQSGDAMVAGLLDELERLLLDISNSPARLDATELIELRRRIEQRGILTKIRVVGGEARRAARPAAPQAQT